MSCAPLNSSVDLASSSKLTFVDTCIFLEWILTAPQLASPHRVNHPTQKNALHDPSPSILRRQRELNLAIEPPRAQQRGVEDVDPVRGGDDLDAVVTPEAV